VDSSIESSGALETAPSQEVLPDEQEASSSVELSPPSVFDSADPVVANLPAVFDSLEAEPRGFSSSSEPGIHLPHFQDEEPTLYLRKTLRSGQRVVFAGNVVLLGDLNPGAQIEADGDVIVLGQLRGSVHAGCEGDQEATVITSSLRATQLRIADRFYQADSGSRFFRKSPPTGTLRARLDGDTVVVEALPVR
jgi:septum site-determining protein MinC